MCSPAVLLPGPPCWEPLWGCVLLRAELGQMGPPVLLVAQKGQCHSEPDRAGAAAGAPN